MPAHDDGGTPSGAGVRKPPMEETAGRWAKWRVRGYGDFVAGGVCPRFVERVLWTRSRRTTAMGRTGIEQRFDKAVAQVAVAASDLVAGREPAKLTRWSVMLPRTAAIMMCRS
jgi:hypothetical protein